VSPSTTQSIRGPLLQSEKAAVSRIDVIAMPRKCGGSARGDYPGKPVVSLRIGSSDHGFLRSFRAKGTVGNFKGRTARDNWVEEANS
jgi:hypothetical protein